MSDLDAMRAGVETLKVQERTLDEQRLAAKSKENAAMALLREIGTQVRAARAARVELERRIRAQEDPLPPVTPEVETIIQSVVATAQAANAPPETEA